MLSKIVNLYTINLFFEKFLIFSFYLLSANAIPSYELGFKAWGEIQGVEDFVVGGWKMLKEREFECNGDFFEGVGNYYV